MILPRLVFPGITHGQNIGRVFNFGYGFCVFGTVMLLPSKTVYLKVENSAKNHV